MTITNYEFGSISIDETTYHSDVIISPDEVIDSWWRKEGHSLDIDDLHEVVNAKPDLLVIGTGYYGKMQVPDQTIQYLLHKGIEVRQAATKDSVSVFNSLQHEYARIVAALHLTC